ncbi:MAG: type I restriction enzyme HsdR N-terminal domain-containing protein [Deltaproteobacteria bacterium]|nr:type I restriction enzyme HsdR N-terminal domain-containing protein [Deltaproteobacteria bacterium]
MTAVIVPHGKVVDFIDRKFRKETPEEYVRQEIEKSLVREYKYLREEIAVEFPIKIGSKNKRVDLAVFPEGSAHRQETAWALIECKAATVSPNDKEDGVEQLKSYLAASLNAEFGMWTNGHGGNRECFRKVSNGKGFEFAPIDDIPAKGRSIDDVERPSLASLSPANSDALLFAFRRCHNYIAGNQGLQKPEAFWELLKIIFCKIMDERSEQIEFYATSQERQNLNGQLKVKKRLDGIFAIVREKYSTIFKPNEVIELAPLVLAYIVSQLQSYFLLDTNIDVKGKAYEEIVGSNLRGDRGEFFTPRNICRMAVEMLDPDPRDLILDPFCGTGGFLTIALNHVIQKIRVTEARKWRDKEHPTEREQTELLRRIKEYCDAKIVGLDFNPNLVRATKMNMVMNNDGEGGLYQANSLGNPVLWEEKLRSRNLLGRVDLIFTNPPFGSKIRIDDPAILEQYEIAKVYDYDDNADTFSPRNPVALQRALPPEILAIERCVSFLKPGTGRVAIVLPDGILGAPGLGYVREWILTNTRVLASIDLHPDTFQPRNSTQTSVLVLQRKRFDEIALERATGEKNDYSVFMSLANHVGHDKRGNTTYVRDADGNEIVREEDELIKEHGNGHPVYRRQKTMNKVEDDNTREIANAFRSWLAGQE